MNFLDWSIIAAYLAGLVLLSIRLGAGQRSQEDYYVGGRSLPWWAVGISTMATQTSAVSFISIPAFVALVPGGGLTWLQYELALPLAMIVVIVVLLPFFRELELISVYEYLERRYSPAARNLLAGVFLVSRGLATGVAVYACAIVLSVTMAAPLWATILLIGIVTLVYDTIGGIKVVVYSDVIQMALLTTGAVICILFALDQSGGWAATLGAFSTDRFSALDFTHGLGDGGQAPFWGFLVGGLFLYISYYGCDQSQVQRELSASSPEHTRYSLVLNALARFPLTILYVLAGLTVGAVMLNRPDLAALIPQEKPDYMIPLFIVHVLPHGVKAIIFAAILAAAMSSLDSALNALSASTMRDFVEKRLPPGTSDQRRLTLGKVTTVAWGIFITGFAFVVGDISGSVIVGINKIGSAFYGPILAAFLLGVATKRTTSRGVIAGIITGVGFNLGLWIFTPGVFWMWWNCFGCLVTAATSIVVSLFDNSFDPSRSEGLTIRDRAGRRQEKPRYALYGLLALYFLVILGLCRLAPNLLAP